MKNAFLSLFAAACSVLTASAVDATAANIWLAHNTKAEFLPAGKGIVSDKYSSAPTFSRTWQYVSIPLCVEGKLKGDGADYPHFIPELKLRISLAIMVEDDKGKPMKKPVILQKDITYVDVPLVKSDKKTGESVVKVGVFVSPSSAFKLSRKDGDLRKKLVGVAVEGTFMGANCNKTKGSSGENPVVGLLFNTNMEKELPGKWWKNAPNTTTGAQLYAISETPFAAQYADSGFPPTSPLYGSADSSSSSSSSTSSTSTSTSDGGPVTPAETEEETSTDAADSSGSTSDSAAEEEESGSSKRGNKRGNKRGSKRTRR